MGYDKKYNGYIKSKVQGGELSISSCERVN